MAAGTALTIAGAGLSAFGSLMGGLGRSRDEKRQAALNRFNAAVSRHNARIEERAMRRAGRRFIGAQRAAIGASGITAEGSPTDVIGFTAGEIEFDILSNTFARELEAMGFEMGAAAANARARDARLGGFLGAASAILGAFD